MLCAVLLIVPVAVKWMPNLTPLAAAVLAVEALALSVNNARYSLQLAVTNPLVWTLAMAVNGGVRGLGAVHTAGLTEGRHMAP
jgi:hypothetical protein